MRKILTLLFFTAFCLQVNASIKITDSKIIEAIDFCKKNKLDTNLIIMVDMSINSGKNRLFVYDTKKKEVVIESLCVHGGGKGSTAFKPVFSNEIGSKCSSLGKYKVQTRSYSKWGINIHYKMHGLEKTNSNAFKRYIVLHSYTPVPNFETYPIPFFGPSDGCPVISNKAMSKIDALIKNKKNPLLLWIYS